MRPLSRWLGAGNGGSFTPTAMAGQGATESVSQSLGGEDFGVRLGRALSEKSGETAGDAAAWPRVSTTCRRFLSLARVLSDTA